MGRKVPLLALVVICLGCGPSLFDQREETVEVGEIVAIPIDAVGKERTVKVTAESTGAPIHVHIYLKQHEEAIERKIALGKPPENLLGVEQSTVQAAFEIKVPADKESVVRLQSASRETAVVSVKIEAN